MPGLVVFRRRWSVGSDDLVVPGAFLLIIHFICFIIVAVALLVFHYDSSVLSTKLLWYHQLGYLVILFLSICAESGICIISMRGSILDSGVRTTINLWIYFKSMVMFFDITWLVLGTIWLSNYYIEDPVDEKKKLFIAIIICNWSLVLTTVITIWCTFDAAGRSWVKMKQYQRSMRETESRFNYRRSGNTNRNWRQRKVIRAYQDSWDHRCRLLFCCIGSSERNRNSFTDIARLLSDFFRELDVVPSDVVAGLVLLRKFQKLEREAIVRQRKNGTYEFLSGVPITAHTKFLALNDAKNYDFFQKVIHFMYFAQGAYGWPMYFIINRSKMWHLLPEMKCFGCCCGHNDDSEIIQDNCCYCNYAALKKTLQVGDTEIIYVTYHVDVGETPFFVAIDYTQKKIVVSIRGTLSMKDILTDLNAEGDVLPLNPPRDDWLGHKGMVQAAIYIKNKLQEENLIEKAFNRNPDRNTHTFGLVLVGHSLGAGTAAILAILMKPDYPSLQCFSYSPPGGLLSMPAVEYSKSFITSVVLGKDVVPRIGLYQMEALRADLINAIQRSVDPKWKTISCSVICCGCGPEPTSVVEMSGQDTHINQYQEQRDTARSNSSHPTDSTIALTLHQPLYPPGRIIHIVRHHPKPAENVLKSREPVYQAIWADTTDFDEVLISPVMLQDHMPDKVLAALKKLFVFSDVLENVVTTSGPRKPQRQTSNAFSTTSNDPDLSDADGEDPAYVGAIPSTLKFGANEPSTHRSFTSLSQSLPLSPTAQHKVCLETSFTNLQSPSEMYHGSSKASSIAGSLLGRSQMSSGQYDISSIIDDSITTVTRRSPSVPSETATVIVNEPDAAADVVGEGEHRLKSVAFDMDISYTAMRTPSPQMPLKSILHRQFSARTVAKPKTLPFPPLRRASDATGTVDLLHDDWFGLAPLASPETLSEISSISSRTPSAPMSLSNSFEHYLQNMPLKENGGKPLLEDIFESQLHTPKVMRRAPKFTENLSTCAENVKNVDNYKRFGRVFITFPQVFPTPDQGTESSDDSFESAQSLSRLQKQVTFRPKNNTIKSQKESSKSADQLDDELQAKKECPTIKLALSDSQILNEECKSSCPNCPCKNVEICCSQTNHDHCIASFNNPCDSNKVKTSSESKDTTFYSANSSLEQFDTPHKTPDTSYSVKYSDKEETLIRPGVLESHFPVVEPNSAAKPSALGAVVGGRVRKRMSSEEFIFTRNDEPSSLVQMLDNYAGTSPCINGRKRKGCVYPANNNIKATRSTMFLTDSPSRSFSQGHESSV